MANRVDKHEARGIRRLAAAVLVQAISDIHRGTVSNRRSATEWFLAAESGGLTFNTCCEILDRNAKEVRNNLLTDDGVPRIFLRFGPLDSGWGRAA